MHFPFEVKFCAISICHCVEKRTKINEKRPDLAHKIKVGIGSYGGSVGRAVETTTF